MPGHASVSRLARWCDHPLTCLSHASKLMGQARTQQQSYEAGGHLIGASSLPTQTSLTDQNSSEPQAQAIHLERDR